MPHSIAERKPCRLHDEGNDTSTLTTYEAIELTLLRRHNKQPFLGSRVMPR